MKSLSEIIQLLDFSELIKHSILALEPACRTKIDQELIKKLAQKDEWIHAEQMVKKLLAHDEHGLQMLCCLMMSAIRTYEQYQTLMIPESIFIDTMNCFPRFVSEYEMMYGTAGFDRSFWTGRQLSLSLFRIKELEFELVEENQEVIISIHIPSDAKLQREQCISSILEAKQFFQTYHFCDSEVPMVCESWLLSPALESLLPKHSHIRQFQSLFEIQSWDQEATDYLMWVYHSAETNPMELSENTSLQRCMKQHLIHGGKIGNAKGVLKQLEEV